MKKILILVVLAFMATVACGQIQNDTEKADIQQTQNDESVKQNLDEILTALKTLDMNTFNTYSDNQYESKFEEYQIFSGLMKKDKQQVEAERRFAEKVMEDFSWKIGDEKINGETAKIKVTLQNRDMTDVIGNYTVDILSNVSVTGQYQNNSYDLCSYIDAQKGTQYQKEVTITLQKEQYKWILLLNDDVINAIMGNMNTEVYSPEVENKIKEQENRIEQQANEITEEMEKVWE